MTIWKRIKRLWILLTTEEVFDEHGSDAGRWCAGRLGPRASDVQKAAVPRVRDPGSCAGSVQQVHGKWRGCSPFRRVATS